MAEQRADAATREFATIIHLYWRVRRAREKDGCVTGKGCCVTVRKGESVLLYTRYHAKARLFLEEI